MEKFFALFPFSMFRYSWKECFPKNCRTGELQSMKMNYNQVKTALSKLVKSTKYFNRDFYKRYKKAVQNVSKCLKNGIDDSYEMDGIRLYHSWDDVYSTDFYQKNSCAYCEFLSIVHGAELI